MQKANDEFDDEEEDEEKEQHEEPQPENGPKLLTSVAEDTSMRILSQQYTIMNFIYSSSCSIQPSMACQLGVPDYHLTLYHSMQWLWSAPTCGREHMRLLYTSTCMLLALHQYCGGGQT